MKKAFKILIVSCLCVLLADKDVAYGDNVSKSPHVAERVTAREDYSHIAVSQVSDYVNIREEANTSSKIVGKIYNHCAAEIQETVEGEGGNWYRIRSGTVTGYISARYFITGQEAERLAQSIGREFVTINTESLRLREQPDLNSKVLTILSQGARYVVQGEEGEFFKVEVDADLVGYIAREYCRTAVEFDQAVSVEEEWQKLAETARREQEAAEAMTALEQVKRNEGYIAANPLQSDNASQSEEPPAIAVPAADFPAATGEPGTDHVAAGGNPLDDAVGRPPSSSTAGGGPSGPGGTLPGPSGNAFPTGSPSGSSEAVTSATRTAIVAYAKQFLGRPYVYGGTSLTDGTDCSGFTQGVYAHFGITTGRSSRDQAENGRAIAVDAVQPGDLLFYASGDYINHVALYIGGGQVIHASNSTTGIIISPYNYRTPCKAVTFINTQ